MAGCSSMTLKGHVHCAGCGDAYHRVQLYFIQILNVNLCGRCANRVWQSLRYEHHLHYEPDDD